MTNTITLSVPAAYIDAALCAVSKEEARYYLKGVFIDARGFIAATNGHIAFAAKYPEAAALADVRPANVEHAQPGIIVPTDALKLIAKGKSDVVTLKRDNGQWWASRGALVTHFDPVDGAFPDWTRVIPEVPETETAAHYQPQYVAAMGDMAKALRDGKKDSASFYHIHQSGEGPALVTFPVANVRSDDPFGPRPDCCAVIMPMRSRGHDGFNRAAFLATA